MSDPNLKAMTQAELLKYLEDDFMPRLLPKLANVQNIEAENARLKAEVERLRKAGDAMRDEGEKIAHDVSWGPFFWDNRVADWNAAKEGKQS